MSRAISPAAKQAEQNLLTAVRLAGIERGEKSHQYKIKGVPYRVHAYADKELCEEFGGKVRAMRLLRLSALLMQLSKRDPKMFDPLESAFEEVAVQFPLLKSYYQAARLGGCFGTWIRWD